MTKRAFTLLELIVVISIILVLAAIALPNFLEARTRSQIARVRADHSSIRNALESYRVDNGGLPEHIFESPILFWYAVAWEITTPIAYLSSRESLEDPFASDNLYGSIENVAVPVVEDEYLYVNWELRDRDLIDGIFGTFSVFNREQWYGADETYRRDEFGGWELASLGPARDFQIASDPSDLFGHYFLLYDPTNGTVSDGAIVRSGASPEGRPLSGYIADGLPGD